MATQKTKTKYIISILDENGNGEDWDFDSEYEMRKFLSHFFDSYRNLEVQFSKKEWIFDNDTQEFLTPVTTEISLPEIIWKKYRCTLHVGTTNDDTVYKRIQYDFDSKIQLKKFMNEFVTIYGTSIGLKKFILEERQLKKNNQNGIYWNSVQISL